MSPDNVWIKRLDAETVETLTLAADGPLAGQRVAVKDNVDVAGFTTTAGCPSFGYEPVATATAVARLVAEGAVVVGKTNLDQFATGLVGTRSPHGVVGHPHRPGYITGGSSSGSAAAVAAGEADIGIATDTAGSGRVPAALCGLVGLKGTRGWVPNTGVVPACASFDCTTAMARTLREAVAATLTMAGPDDADASCRVRPPGGTPPVRRLGVLAPADLGECSSEVLAGYWAAQERAVALGLQIVEVELAAYFEAGALLYGGAFVAERHAAVGAFLASGPPDADPVVAGIIGAAASVTAGEYLADVASLAQLCAEAGRVWSEVDAVLLPTVPRHPTVAEVVDDPVAVNLDLGRFVSGANLVDWCAAVVPIPHDGVTFGAQLLAPAWHDEVLWALAGALLGEPLTITGPAGPGEVDLAVVGAHLEGQPLNHQLTDRGGRLVRSSRTAPEYRMVLLDGPLPKPGLVRDARAAASLEVEVWRLDHLGFGQFVEGVPSPLAIGTLELDDGTMVHGFLCEDAAAADAPDISAHGSWRAWLAHR